MRDEIKLQLNHDYLSIRVYEKGKKTEDLQLPVRCAKIIGEMFEIRKSDKKDLLNYCRWVGHNVKYKVTVWMSNITYGAEIGEWFHEEIKPISKEKLKEVGGSYK